MLYLNWLGNIFQIQKHTTHYFQNHSRLVHICESHETAVNMFLHWCKLFFLNATHSLGTFKAYYIYCMTFLIYAAKLSCNVTFLQLLWKTNRNPYLVPTNLLRKDGLCSPMACLPTDRPQGLDIGPCVKIVVGLRQLLHQHVDQL